MADISVTASAVLAAADARVVKGTAGATITAGQAVYRDTDRKFKLADANNASATVRAAVGIALNGASDGQPIAVIYEGDLTMNAVLTGGIPYFLSSDPGGICAIADVGSGEYVCQLGIASSTTVLKVKPIYTGVAN